MFKLRHLAPVLAGLAAAAVVGFAPAALASDNANGSTLYATGDSCNGAPASAQVKANDVGFVNIHLDGRTATGNYHLKGAVPDATYNVYGYSGFCNFDGFLGTVVTNDNGTGNMDFTYVIPAGDTQVFIFSDQFTTGFTTAETAAVTP